MHQTARWSATICIPAQRKAPGSGHQGEVIVQTYNYALYKQSRAEGSYAVLVALYNDSVAAQPCLIEEYVLLFSSAILATARNPDIFKQLLRWTKDYVAWATCCDKATAAVAVVLSNFFTDFARSPSSCQDLIDDLHIYLDEIDAKCNGVAFMIECHL